MPHNQTMDAVIAAGVMFLAGDKALFLKRSDLGDMAGTWCFPGGKVEAGETLEAAASRECLEEIGHAPASLSPLDFSDAGGVQFTTYLCVGEEFPVTLNGEHTAYAWASLDNPPSPLHPGVAMTIQKYRQTETIDSARVEDQNGFVEIKDNPITKVGVFPYSGRMIGAEEPDRIYMVYRPEETVSDPECINSFRLMPFIDEHAMLGDEDEGYMAPEKKGIHGVTGEDVKFVKNEKWPFGALLTNLKMFTNSIKHVINMGKRELSIGYRATYEFKKGVFNGLSYDAIQTSIRGNHLALVKEGRSGSDIAVLDHLKLTFDSKELLDMAKQALSQKIKQAEDELSAVKTAMTAMDEAESPQGLADLAAKVDTIMTLLAELKEMEKAEAEEESAEEVAEVVVSEDEDSEKDAQDEDEDGKKDDEEKESMDAAEFRRLRKEVSDLKNGGTKALLREINQRDSLYAKGSKFVGAFDHSEMTLPEVQKYLVRKIGIQCQDGHEGAALNGFFAAAEQATKKVKVTSDSADTGMPGDLSFLQPVKAGE